MEPAPRTTYREVLALREFRAVLVAWLSSMLGTVVAHVALAVLVFERSGSPFLSALAFSIGWVPHLLIGTLLSGVVDRVRPRRLLVGCELVSAGLVTCMLVPAVPVAGLLGLVVLQGCVTPLFMAARSATLPDLLPGDSYVLGRSLLHLVAQSAQLVGYAVGGVLLAFVAPRTALALDAASFVLSAVVLRLGMADRPASPVAAATGSVARASLDGLRRLWRTPRLRALLLLGWLPPMLGVVPEAVAVPYADALGAPAGAAGALLAATAAGVILGDLLVARLLRPAERLRWMGPLAMAVFLPPLGFVVEPSLPLAVALLVVSGIGWGYSAGQSQALLAALPLDLRGRGLAVAGSGAMLTQALGFTLGGALAEIMAPHDVVVVGAVAGLVVTASVLRSLRRAGGVDDLVSAPGAPAAPGPAA